MSGELKDNEENIIASENSSLVSSARRSINKKLFKSCEKISFSSGTNTATILALALSLLVLNLQQLLACLLNNFYLNKNWRLWICVNLYCHAIYSIPTLSEEISNWLPLGFGLLFNLGFWYCKTVRSTPSTKVLQNKPILIETIVIFLPQIKLLQPGSFGHNGTFVQKSGRNNWRILSKEFFKIIFPLVISITIMRTTKTRRIHIPFNFLFTTISTYITTTKIKFHEKN